MAASRLPPWLKPSLRLILASSSRRPTKPSDKAAIAGGMIAEAAPSIACAAMTAQKRGNRTIIRHPRPTISPETAISNRLARVPSTSRPAGIWQIAAATDEAPMARPIAPESQCWAPFR